MSINIHNGYRIRTSDPEAFLHAVEAVVAPVRSRLDAATYAEVVADLIDRRDRGTRPLKESVKADALAEFTHLVTDGNPGHVWHHPHSFNLDYGYPPGTDRATGWLYLLVHCQRQEYRDAVESLPGVEPYPYWNHSEGPEDLTEEDWTQRRADWGWLIDAHRIGDVTSRYTFRPDPAPDRSYVLRDQTILGYLPSRAARAKAVARDLAVLERFSGESNMANRLGEVFTVLASPRVQELADQIEPTLRHISVADLHITA